MPAISVTIARFAFNKALKSDDLPTFGRPTMATFIPCLRIFEDRAQDKILSISESDFSKLSIRYEYSGSATSSGKSIPATILDKVSKICPLICDIFSLRTPERFFAD